MFSKKIQYLAIHVAIYTILIHCQVVISAGGDAEIPEDAAQLAGWFNANIKPVADRKGTLDPELVEAEAQPQVIKVKKDGSGDFKTINDAIKSIPAGNKKRVIVWIGVGVYEEKVTIEREKKFVTLYGSPDARPTLTFGGTAAMYGTVDSASVIALSDYFMACNLIIANSAPRPDGKRAGAQAVALRVSGDKSAIYNCKLLGFQDTLCDDRGNHFFKDCHIEGTVDFIFGSGKSIYLSTTLNALGGDQPTVITAQARESSSEDTGFSFVHCSITGTGKGTYLGRAWKTHPHVVYAYTNMGQVIHPAGWSEGNEKTVFYGEYKCSGPGAAVGERAKFTQQLAEAAVKPFLSLDYIKADKWLLPPPKV